jgi:hypothetical protein
MQVEGHRFCGLGFALSSLLKPFVHFLVLEDPV